MYEAKAGGKNRSILYAPGIDAERHADQLIAAEMRSAILDRTIDVAYQPVVRSSDLEIVAVEALARWPRQSYARHAPDKFIAIAEENGLIDDLGALVLAKACETIEKLGSLRVAVNISPVQMRSPQFVKRSLEVIRASGIDPSRVEFEVTEGVLLDNLERTRVQIDELRAAGVTIALDDFGAGYSSVGYLKSIHFDRIKIDRSIVSNLLHDRRQQSIIQGTVMMAHGMGAAVVAEGVESTEELLLLRLAGCEELQGYLFHRPMPAQELHALLQQPAKDYSAASLGRLSSAARSAASS
jgi:EAL domain-containing protein (putative c-di-GMP-specific phosphodiesterase class I)